MAKKATSVPEELETLAGEYVLGVMEADERKQFEKLAAGLVDASQAQLKWENRLAGLNENYIEQAPPIEIKSRIDQRLFENNTVQSVKSGLWHNLAFWRGLGLTGTLAALAVGIFASQTFNQLTLKNSELASVIEQKSKSESDIKIYENELASRNLQLDEAEKKLAGQTKQLSALKTQLAATAEELTNADNLLANARAELSEALAKDQPLLVASLDSKDNDYRFLAAHEEGSDKVRMSLVSGTIEADNDFELWLVEPEKQIVSLGVLSTGKTSVTLSPEYLKIFEAGGLLAVSIEQKGGSPTGVAQGPVVALGKPEQL